MTTKIKTKSGFECEIDEKALDDAELLDLLVDIDDGDVMQFPRVVKKLLGNENKKALYDHLRTEDGRVPNEPLSAELGEIFRALKSKKKS